jgi:hypothetical protein
MSFFVMFHRMILCEKSSMILFKRECCHVLTDACHDDTKIDYPVDFVSVPVWDSASAAQNGIWRQNNPLYGWALMWYCSFGDDLMIIQCVVGAPISTRYIAELSTESISSFSLLVFMTSRLHMLFPIRPWPYLLVQSPVGLFCIPSVYICKKGVDTISMTILLES